MRSKLRTLFHSRNCCRGRFGRRRLLVKLGVEPDRYRFSVQEGFSVQQSGLLHVGVGGSDQTSSVGLAQEDHEVFGLLDDDSQRRSEHMMGYLDGISLHLLDGLK